jgi:hypothetical protein
VHSIKLVIILAVTSARARTPAYRESRGYAATLKNALVNVVSRDEIFSLTPARRRHQGASFEFFISLGN